MFIAWLLPEPERTDDIRAVLNAAERGAVKIVTSVLTLVEVIKLKGHDRLPSAQREKIRQFFERSCFATRGLDRSAGYGGRDLIWNYGLDPKDAIHVATALHAKVRIFETHDSKLLDLNGKIPIPGAAGNLAIRLPHFAETYELFPKVVGRQASTHKRSRS